jgi:uncharacterized protein YjaZ
MCFIPLILSLLCCAAVGCSSTYARTPDTHLHTYANPRERKLWEEFRQEMNGKSSINWLYNGSQAKDRPADLGYYIGYKICEAYYQNAANKKQAVKDILEIKDSNQFLRASMYDEKFSGERQ